MESYSEPLENATKTINAARRSAIPKGMMKIVGPARIFNSE
jgi:hypothetical protein